MRPPTVAIIYNANTPYRSYVHRRLASELKDVVTIRSVYTHGRANQPWELAGEGQDEPVTFGEGEITTPLKPVRSILPDWRKGGKIIQWLQQHQVKALVVGGYNDLTRLRIINWAHRNKIPCFLHADSNSRGDLASGLRAIVKRHLLPRIVSHCSGVFVFGRRGQEFFLRYGADRSRLYLLPYEPDYSVIEETSDSCIASMCRRFGLDPKRRRFLFCGRLAQVKRVDLAIRAFLLVAASRPEWDLLIVGEGALEDQLRALVPPELSKRVIWAGFVGDQTQLAGLYHASEVLVIPSDYEPWALVVNEAVAAGLAIIASDVVGSAADLVQDHVNGRLFPAGSLEHLITCLLDVSEEGRLCAMQTASKAVLSNYRAQADPLVGLTAALRANGVLPQAIGRPLR